MHQRRRCCTFDQNDFEQFHISTLSLDEDLNSGELSKITTAMKTVPLVIVEQPAAIYIMIHMGVFNEFSP